MSELTVTLIRFGLLALLWVFVFSIVGVLRTDLYGTRVSRRRARIKDKKRPETISAPSAAAASGVSPASTTKKRKTRNEPGTVAVLEGSLAGTRLPLTPSGILIGRNPECTLVLDDDYASGRHARITLTNNGWVVEDLGSTNGTFLADVRLTSTQPLALGSRIRIGRTLLEIQG